MKRIWFFGICLIILLGLWQTQQKNSQNPIEISKEATSTAQITAGEVATVAFVIDGDTIELTDGRRVRYIGIDAPEAEECFIEKSREENKRLVDKKTVRLEKDISDTDNYGRLLRNVYVNALFVNAELVKGGFARAWNVPPDEKFKDTLFASQQEAKDANLGLWQACRK